MAPRRDPGPFVGQKLAAAAEQHDRAEPEGTHKVEHHDEPDVPPGRADDVDGADPVPC